MVKYTAKVLISRKTWGANGPTSLSKKESRIEQIQEELAGLRAAREKLKHDFEDVCFENRWRKLAWEIHKVEELIKKKGAVTTKRRKKRRQ